MEEVMIRLDDHGNGLATIFFKGERWKRVPGDGPDAPAEWRADEGRLEVADREHRRIFEHAHRHPDTAKPVRRFPRLAWERKAGQPVYCLAFGFGKIVAIVDSKVVVKFRKQERVMNSQDLMTCAQAQADWHLYWLRGERRRLEEGRRLSIIKSLCRHGEWQAFLDKYDYPRSTADDLIEHYNNEVRWEARTELPGNRAIQAGEPERPTNERKELVKKEIEKRRGKKPSYHKSLWSIRIKLPPDILNLCRERYRLGGEDAKEFWRRAAYQFVDIEPPDEKVPAIPSAS